MHPLIRLRAALGFLTLLLLPAAYAIGALPNQVTLVPDASVAANPVNAPQAFTVSTAGSYTVTLTDLATPTPLGSMSVAITTANGPAQAFSLTTNGAATAPYSVTKTATFAAGSYFAQVLASASQPGGTFSVVVTPVSPAGSAAVLSYHDVIAAPSTPTVGSAVQQKFTITASGSYTLAAQDFGFPAPLAAGTLDIIVLNDCSGSSSPTCTSQVVLSNLSVAGPSTASLAAGPYVLYAYAQADPVAMGGLYNLAITGGGSPATAYAATIPVGQLPTGYSFSVSAGVPISFSLADLGMGGGLPLVSTLTTLKAIVTEGTAAPLANLSSPTGATPDTFTPTTSGTAELFVYATPSNSTGLGAWSAYFSQGTGGSATTIADVAAPVAESGHFGYIFSTPALLASDTYSVAVHDFQVPQALAQQNAIVEQKGSALASAAAANPQSVDLNIPAQTSGAVNVLIFLTLQAGSPNDLFGVSVQNQTNGVNALQTTQAVGTLFTAIPLNSLTAGANYGVTFTDLGFPAAFTSVSAIGTQGNTEIGTITPGGAGQGGTFKFTAPASGSTTLNILAEPGAMHYGLYGVTAGLVPTATLTPGAVSVGGAQDVTLSWTSTDATGCAASGGWSGARPVSGSMVDVGALTQTTSYTLICTGPGGPSAPQTVTVNYSSSSSSSSSGGGSGSGSKSGGGAITPEWLLALGVLAGLKLRRRRAMLAGFGPRA